MDEFLVDLMAHDSVPTCKFIHDDRAATYWAGPCTNGLASGMGVAISSYWSYRGHARNGRAHGDGEFIGFIPAPPDRSPEQMDRVKSRVDGWNDGSPVGVYEECYYYMPQTFPHYRGCFYERDCCQRDSGM